MTEGPDVADLGPKLKIVFSRWGWAWVALAWLAVPSCAFEFVPEIFWPGSILCGLVLFAIGLSGKNGAFIQALMAWSATVVGWFVGASHITIQHGRQLLGRRGPIKPSRRQNTKHPAAALWIKQGDMELVSVAAFAKLSVELMQVGAPLHLWKSCHDHALEEVHHASLCWQLARRFDPAADAFEQAVPDLARVRRRTVNLDTLASESLVDGALAERVSAVVAASLAEDVSDELIRTALITIARDENVHADHAWEIINWCVDQGVSPDALVQTLRRVKPLKLESTAIEADGAFESAGIAGHARWRQAERQVIAEVRERLCRSSMSPGSSPRVHHPSV